MKNTNNFNFLKEYIVDDKKAANNKKHIFYRIDKADIDCAEKRMNYKFPRELKEFYLEIGYGFLCCDHTTNVDRLMEPDDVADFWCENCRFYKRFYY